MPLARSFLRIQQELPIYKPTLFNRDRLINADRKRVADMAVLAFDRLQGFTPKFSEEQVLALASTFILLCKRLKIEPQDAFTAASNLMIDRTRRDNKAEQFAGLEVYIKDDLLPSRAPVTRTFQ